MGTVYGQEGDTFGKERGMSAKTLSGIKYALQMHREQIVEIAKKDMVSVDDIHLIIQLANECNELMDFACRISMRVPVTAASLVEASQKVKASRKS